MRALALALLALVACQSSPRTGDAATWQVSPRAASTAPRRVGVNLGSWAWWGAEQLSANVVMNPGFEGVVDRCLVIVAQAGSHSFTDDSAGLGRADGFWAGARFDVRTGAAAGARGSLIHSLQSGRGGRPEFTTDGQMPPVVAGDVVAITRVRDDLPPSHWWIPEASAPYITPDQSQRPPGSVGRRSLVLRPPIAGPVEVITYLDAIGERAGRLLPVEGEWLLSFWCRTSGPGQLEVDLGRQGQPALFQQRLVPGSSWSRYQLAFKSRDAGPATTLGLRFRAAGAPVWLDEVDLRAAIDSARPFRAQVAAALKELRPGLLRDWSGQLGDALENRLAPPFARRAWRYRPGERSDLMYGYSLPEFLDLCQEVGASPWITIPTAFGDDELTGLGRYLAQAWSKHGFAEVLVEFGNENWNDIFRPAGIADPRAHAEAARRAFRLVRFGAGQGVPLVTVANGQYAVPERALAVARALPEADLLAVAPYQLSSLDGGLSLESRLERLFADDGHDLATLGEGVAGLHRELAAAEVNLHTTRGSASPAERDALTAGAAGGAALARTLLRAYAVGARRQCAYALAGFDTRLADQDGYTRLWGLVRDLGPTGRLRPTGQAVSLLNRAIAGDLHAVEGPADPAVTMAAFRSATGWSLAAVSAAPTPRTITVSFPDDAGGALPSRLLQLAAPRPDAGNEERQEVTVTESPLTVAGATVTCDIPPWGLIVLLPPERSL